MFEGGVSHGFWKLIENQRWYFNWTAKRLNVQKKRMIGTLSRFQSSSNKQGGAGLLQVYSNSPLRALQVVYPDHRWLSLEIYQHSKGIYWNDRKNQRQFFFEWFGKEHGLKEPGDWYNISVEELSKYSEIGLLLSHHSGNLSKAPQSLFPEIDWLPSLVDQTRRTSESLCTTQGFFLLAQIFPERNLTNGLSKKNETLQR